MDKDTRTFEDALQATQEQLNAAPPAEEFPAEEFPTEEFPAKPDVLAQLQEQNQQLAQQNQQLQSMLTELSERKQSEVVEEALTPPVLNFSNLWTEDENVVTQQLAQYANEVAEFTEKKLMSQLSPLLDSARQGLAERQQREALNGLSQVPELAGIMGMTPTLEKIIQSNPALSRADVPIEDKLITAYAIAKGAEAIKNGGAKQQPNVDDFIQLYSQSPDLQKRVEAIRAKNAAQNAANLPPMSASSGVFNAALTPQEKPKTFEEAKRLALGRLGL
jgi:hypothetical protein